MTVSNLPLFKMLKGGMNYNSQRVPLLAENIANADTPGYLSKDLKKLNFKELLSSTTSTRTQTAVPEQTHPMHIKSKNAQKTYREMDEKNPSEITIDGNSVSIEEQLIKINQARMDHQMAISLLKKHHQMLNTALGRRS